MQRLHLFPHLRKRFHDIFSIMQMSIGMIEVRFLVGLYLIRAISIERAALRTIMRVLYARRIPGAQLTQLGVRLLSIAK